MRYKNHLLAALAAITLCLLCACGTLQKPGPYNGDKYLYTADATITSSYQVFDSFLTWEMQNRAALQQSNPAIKRFADSIRANAAQWFATAEALRDAYAANPTPANESSLNQAIAVIQAALTQATIYLTATPKPFSP